MANSLHDAAMPPDIIDRHLQWCAQRGMSARTIRDRRYVLARIHRDLPYGLDEATTDELKAWIYRPGWSAQTRHTYRMHVVAFFAWACDPDDPWLDYNPATTRRLPALKVPRGLPRPATDAQIAAALSLPDPWRLHVTLALFAGLRCCEIAGLHREDVDERDVFIRAGKGGDQESVPTRPEVWAAVRDLPPGPIVAQWHRPSPAFWVSNATGRALVSAGIPVTMHQFRHTYGTEICRRQGVRVAQEMLRHKSITSTQVYTFVDSEQRRAAISALPSYQPAAS